MRNSNIMTESAVNHIDRESFYTLIDCFPGLVTQILVLGSLTLPIFFILRNLVKFRRLRQYTIGRIIQSSDSKVHRRSIDSGMKI